MNWESVQREIECKMERDQHSSFLEDKKGPGNRMSCEQQQHPQIDKMINSINPLLVNCLPHTHTRAHMSSDVLTRIAGSFFVNLTTHPTPPHFSHET
jgi:hypothetical protein